MANVTAVPAVQNVFEEIHCVSRMTCSRRFWKQTIPQTVEGLEHEVSIDMEARGSRLRSADMGNECWLAGGRFGVRFIVVETKIKGAHYAGADPGRNESQHLSGDRQGQLQSCATHDPPSGGPALGRAGSCLSALLLPVLNSVGP